MSDTWHKRQYEAALEFAGIEGPAWDDLSDEQRANIRKSNTEHQSFMNDLGNAISTGGPLPSPFRNDNKGEDV